MNKRLFIAIDLPDKSRDKIYRICNNIRTIRWAKRSQIHLTLRFIGNFSESKTNQICDALSGLEFNKFDLTLSGTSFFRSGIFFITLDNSKALTIIKKKLDIMLYETIQLDFEKRSFVPHITLCRMKKRLSFSKSNALINSFAPCFPASFAVDKITLYASELRLNDAVHTPLKVINSRKQAFGCV